MMETQRRTSEAILQSLQVLFLCETLVCLYMDCSVLLFLYRITWCLVMHSRDVLADFVNKAREDPSARPDNFTLTVAPAGTTTTTAAGGGMGRGSVSTVGGGRRLGSAPTTPSLAPSTAASNGTAGRRHGEGESGRGGDRSTETSNRGNNVSRLVSYTPKTYLPFISFPLLVFLPSLLFHAPYTYPFSDPLMIENKIDRTLFFFFTATPEYCTGLRLLLIDMTLSFLFFIAMCVAVDLHQVYHPMTVGEPSAVGREAGEEGESSFRR